MGTDQRDDIRALITRFRNEHRLPAVAGGLVTSASVNIAAFGSRRLHGPEVVTTNDLFHLGSNGKAMTALLIARLVEERKIAWTSTLNDLFGDSVHTMHRDWRDVTLADVMMHASGLPENPARQWWNAERDPSSLRERVVRSTCSEPATRPRGSYLYSNLGYIVAGYAAERVAAGNYESMLLKSVLETMHVASAGFGAAGTAGADDQPLGHETKWLLRRKAVEPGPEADNPPFFSPAGRMHMSVRDYATLLQEVLRMMQGEDRVVRAATMQRMLAMSLQTGMPETRYTAAGWLSTTRPWSKGTAYTHAGSNTLHYAIAWIAPHKDLALFGLTNQGGTLASIALDELIGALLKLV
jgi:CubicO group peptidase (beta-lactamase class C family)